MLCYANVAARKDCSVGFMQKENALAFSSVLCYDTPMSATLQTVRIVDLSWISRDMAVRIRAGQQEAAKVWMVCRDELHRCMAERCKSDANI